MDDARKNSGLRVRVAGILFGFAFTTFWIFLIAVERWAYTSPKAPDRALGQIYAHNEHGAITYFTAFQATSSALMFWSMFFAMILAIAMMPKRDIKVRRFGGLPLGASWKNDDPSGRAKLGVVYGVAISLLLTLILGPLMVSWMNSHGVAFSF